MQSCRHGITQLEKGRGNEPEASADRSVRNTLHSSFSRRRSSDATAFHKQYTVDFVSEVHHITASCNDHSMNANSRRAVSRRQFVDSTLADVTFSIKRVADWLIKPC